MNITRIKLYWIFLRAKRLIRKGKSIPAIVLIRAKTDNKPDLLDELSKYGFISHEHGNPDAGFGLELCAAKRIMELLKAGRNPIK